MKIDGESIQGEQGPKVLWTASFAWDASEESIYCVFTLMPQYVGWRTQVVEALIPVARDDRSPEAFELAVRARAGAIIDNTKFLPS